MNHVRPLLPGLFLAAFCGVLFFPFLGQRDLTRSHEARAAQNAQMILDEGHWLVPRLFDRHIELQKPPLFYWVVAAFGWLGGGRVDVWAVRLPSALAALACVMFLYFLGVRSQRPRVGLLAGLILASSVHFTWLAQVGRIDMPLTLTITVALGASYLGRLEGRWFWHALGYTAVGLGMLLKGPIALVLPALVAGTVWIFERRFAWRSTTLWWGVPLSLMIAAPWYVWANWQTDNQLWEVFFWYHNVERGLGGAEALAAHPWWFYGPRLAVDLLPWSLAIPVALWWFACNPEARQDDGAHFGLIWPLAIVLFLSLMRFKRADYLLPAYPGLAIFLAVWAERWWTNRAPALWPQAGLAVVLVSCLTGWLAFNLLYLSSAEKAWPYRTIAEEIRGRTEKPVIFFRAESHVLAYHLGQPVTTVLEWENLEIWANRPFPVYIVMPENCAWEWQERLPTTALREVLRTSAYPGHARDRPLVVLRSLGTTAAGP
ncbi:MAG: glycosyltransferase family 39 protein [Planctomycetes bacterium]|jgi:4-amino-4-deoxy-L-arabinose transferase-like glycosyltransferase|nr:glycosyltransferase family 39 protein [Planctomycetota bacterium]